MPKFPSVSYVMPVLNEADYLEKAVVSILSQEYPGDKQLVLSLGPSADGTNRVAHKLGEKDDRIILVNNPKGRTPVALNLAIRAATNDVIIRVDAHSEIPVDYTRRGVETLLRVGAHDVGGLMDAKGRTPVQRGIAAAYHSRFGFGGPAYHSGAPEGEAESAYLGIFRREVFEKVGFYNEDMWRAQDWELCLRIRKAGYKVWFDPELKVGYYPRETYKALISQSFASGTWRGEIARRFPEGKSLRHELPPVLLLGIGAGVLSTIAKPILPETTPALLRGLMTLSQIGPVAYGALCTAAGLASKAETLKEKWLTALSFPMIHLPWAAGYIKGRAVGATGTVDKGRVK